MGQTLTHHPHVHCIVPGGGLTLDGRWIASKPNFFLPVPALSRCYRRLFLERLRTAFDAGGLTFLGELARLRDPSAFAEYLKPLRIIPCRVGGDVAIPTPQSGGIKARTGLRMMPTFP